MRPRSKLRTATAVLVRLQVTTGRVALVGLVGAALVVAAVAANVGGGRRGVPDLLTEVVLLVAVPVSSLVFAAASLGDAGEDGSLVYLWLRPVARWRLALAAVAASGAVVLPLNTALVLLVTLVGGRPDLVGPAVVATIGATLAYVSLFVALGLRTRRSLLWGLGYVLLVEGFLARFSEPIAAVSVRRYATSLLTQLGDLGGVLFEVSAGTAAAALLGVGAFGFAACTHWLRTRDVL